MRSHYALSSYFERQSLTLGLYKIECVLVVVWMEGILGMLISNWNWVTVDSVMTTKKNI